MRKRLSRLFARRTAWSYAGIIVLFVGIEALFSFCSKKKSCPPFNDPDFDHWFPYQQGQSVYFRSNLGDDDTLAIAIVNRSEGYETGGGWYSGTCDMSASLYSPHTVGQPPALQVQWARYEGSAQSRAEVVWKEFQLFNATLLRQGITIENPPYSPAYTGQHLASATVNGTSFAQVLEIRRDTTAEKSPGIYKIWLAGGQGLVAYEHYPTQERWVKQ